jgi:hypothetical protein
MSHLNATSKSQASNKQDPFSLLSTNVGKEMPISRIVIAVPNAASTVDAVTEKDRTILVPGWWLRVVSVLHLVTMCLIMDTGQPRIR